MKKSRFDQISEDLIKEVLTDNKVYTTDQKKDWMENRELQRAIFKDNYEEVGSVHYSLAGSPPKGFALYIRNSSKVICYNSIGEEIDCLNGVEVKEVEEEIRENDKYEG